MMKMEGGRREREDKGIEGFDAVERSQKETKAEKMKTEGKEREGNICEQ